MEQAKVDNSQEEEVDKEEQVPMVEEVEEVLAHLDIMKETIKLKITMYQVNQEDHLRHSRNRVKVLRMLFGEHNSNSGVKLVD